MGHFRCPSDRTRKAVGRSRNGLRNGERRRSLVCGVLLLGILDWVVRHCFTLRKGKFAALPFTAQERQIFRRRLFLFPWSRAGRMALLGSLILGFSGWSGCGLVLIDKARWTLIRRRKPRIQQVSDSRKWEEGCQRFWPMPFIRTNQPLCQFLAFRP